MQRSAAQSNQVRERTIYEIGRFEFLRSFQKIDWKPKPKPLYSLQRAAWPEFQKLCQPDCDEVWKTINNYWELSASHLAEVQQLRQALHDWRDYYNISEQNGWILNAALGTLNWWSALIMLGRPLPVPSKLEFGHIAAAEVPTIVFQPWSPLEGEWAEYRARQLRLVKKGLDDFRKRAEARFGKRRPNSKLHARWTAARMTGLSYEKIGTLYPKLNGKHATRQSVAHAVRVFAGTIRLALPESTVS